MSRPILDSYRDETGLQVTATMAAYMIENGYRTYLEAQEAHGFTLWQAERWEEFWIKQGRGGAMPIGPTSIDRARFVDWLEERVTDIRARQRVEAAA